MARRKKKEASALSLLARLHWGWGATLGVVFFVAILWGLPHVLGRTLGTSPLAQASTSSSFHTLLLSLAVLALLLCWSAAAVSWRKGASRRRLLDTQTGLASLCAMDWQAFERLVGEAYRRQGYKVTETGQGGADGGIDLLLHRHGKTEMVQCKQWTKSRVSAPVVREMWGLVAHHGYHGVKIVCVGEFTPDAKAFAHGKNMELVNGASLLALIRSVQSASGHRVPVEVKAVRTPVAPAKKPPHCPQCGAAMVRRTARESGKAFLGCSTYPACRGARFL